MTWKRWTQHVDYFFSFYGLRIRKLKGEILRIEHRYISIEKYPIAFLVWVFFFIFLLHFIDLLLNLQLLDALKELPVFFLLLFVSYICLAFFGTTVLNIGAHHLISRQTITPGVTKIPVKAIQNLVVSKRKYRTRYASGWIYFISVVYARPRRKDDTYLLMSFVDRFEEVELALSALQEHLRVPIEYPEEKGKKRATESKRNTNATKD